MAKSSGGNAGCPCINVEQQLLSLTDRYCYLSDGTEGIKLTYGGACVPPTFGSAVCLQHDMIHDPSCSYDPTTTAVVAPYCFRPWCYVDRESCTRDSDERVYRSSYFDFDSGADIYFSYSTCNSTAEDWFEAQNTILVPQTMGGADILANVPSYNYPCKMTEYVLRIFYWMLFTMAQICSRKVNICQENHSYLLDPSIITILSLGAEFTLNISMILSR